MSLINYEMFTVTEKGWKKKPKEACGGGNCGNMLFFQLDKLLVDLEPEKSFNVIWTITNENSIQQAWITDDGNAG